MCWLTRRLAPATVGLAFCIALTERALAAGAPLDTMGFETFSGGALVPVTNPGTPEIGQQGWVGIDGLGGTTNVEAAVVQSDVTFGGNQALRIDRAANVNNRWAVPFGDQGLVSPGNDISLPSGRFLLIDWDMSVVYSGGDAQAGELGPFFGVEAYNGGETSVQQIASFGVDASTGQVAYQAAGSGAVTNTGVIVTLSSDAWNHFAILLDFAEKSYRTFLNGEFIVSTGFIDGNLIDGFTDADITAIAPTPGSLSGQLTGTAYFDNFRVLDGIPGDFDQDGDVDGDDKGVWEGAYGINAMGDADGDGDSDGHDYVIWQNNLGIDLLFELESAAAAVSAPEPAAALLALLAGAGLAGLRRTRCRNN